MATSVGKPTAAPESKARSQILKNVIVMNTPIRSISPRMAAAPSCQPARARKEFVDIVVIVF
jgi:hypothetical protein